MWEVYKLRFVFSQLIILGALAFFRFYKHWPVEQLAALFVVMQLGSVAGAWWVNRIRTRAQAAGVTPLPKSKR